MLYGPQSFLRGTFHSKERNYRGDQSEGQIGVLGDGSHRSRSDECREIDTFKRKKWPFRPICKILNEFDSG